MDFILNNKQIKEFIERCVASRSQEDKKQYKYEFVAGEYPDFWIELTCTTRGKNDYSQSYNVFLDGGVPYSKVTGPICKDMQKIYIEYMYELFGDEFLIFIEEKLRKNTSETKHAAYDKYLEEARMADSQLIEGLLFIDDIRKNGLKQ